MRLLAVFAHPDDETFGPGGTLARYALTGHICRLVTFTRGEAGSLGPAKYLTPEELGRLRSAELECAVSALQLSSHRLCDLPDKRLAGLPPEAGLAIIRQEIETFEPDLVLTFHRDGISGHPDHQAVARWCLQAVREKPGPRLLGYGIAEAQAHHVGFRRLRPIPDAEVTHIIDVTSYLEYKLRAIECHKSQSELWDRLRSVEGGFSQYAKREHFSQAWPVQGPARSPAERLED
jgi:LmbE family N-acetylglucosaminyl deacetylase